MPFVEIPSDVKALPKSDIPGILAGAIYDADSDDEDVLIRHYWETKHFERTIDEAVRNGHLQPRAPGTCLPMRMATPTSVISVADLAQFLADIQCSVEIRRVEVNAAQPQAAAPALVVAESAEDAPIVHWKMKIQAEAAARFKRLRAAGASPTTHSILDDMANWCRVNDVKTDGGIYPSAGYLRTHVLGGKHWTPPR